MDSTLRGRLIEEAGTFRRLAATARAMWASCQEPRARDRLDQIVSRYERFAQEAEESALSANASISPQGSSGPRSAIGAWLARAKDALSCGGVTDGTLPLDGS